MEITIQQPEVVVLAGVATTSVNLELRLCAFTEAKLPRRRSTVSITARIDFRWDFLVAAPLVEQGEPSEVHTRVLCTCATGETYLAGR